MYQDIIMSLKRKRDGLGDQQAALAHEYNRIARDMYAVCSAIEAVDNDRAHFIASAKEGIDPLIAKLSYGGS